VGQEIELKFTLPPGVATGTDQLTWLRNPASGVPQQQVLVSVYFDTAQRTFQEHGLSLRVRQTGSRRLQTVKALTPTVSHAFGREPAR
jgi:triphosphatase